MAERRSKLARAVASRFAIGKVYQDHLELAADPEIDAVAVSVNYAQQGEIAADLLKAGKHVFMEKPLAVSSVQAERILDAAASGNARLMVAYMKRFDPGNILARAIYSGMGYKMERKAGFCMRVTTASGAIGSMVSAGQSPFTNTDEPIEAFDAANVLPALVAT